MHLLERDAEERREQEEARHARRVRARTRDRDRGRAHARLSSSSASSSTRAAARQLLAPLRRERRAVELAVAPARVQRRGARRGSPARPRAPRRCPAPVSRMSSAAAPSGGTTREHRPLGGEVLEHLPGEDAAAAAARLGDEQQQRVGLALQAQRSPPRHVVDQLDAVAEPEALHELAVAGPEVAEEAHGHVLEPGVGERAQERLRVALAEERARMREPEAVAAHVLEPREVVEVAAVRDRHDRPSRVRARASRRRSHSAAATIASAWRATRCATPRAPSASRARRCLPPSGARAARSSRAGRRPISRRSPSSPPRRSGGRSRAARS